MMDWQIRHRDTGDADTAAFVDKLRDRITELASRVNTLDFKGADSDAAGADASEELEVEATVDNLRNVMDFVDEYLERIGCGMKEQMQIDVAVEEIFVNIANYAYAPGTGKAKVSLSTEASPQAVLIRFTDSGVPYNPMAKEDPDVTLAAEDREIGGLGIFMVKKSMDDVIYEYRDGQNILTLKKLI